jgi:uncharacterized protein YicC (UPF0701 family)
MNNYKRLKLIPILLASLSIAHVAFGQSPPLQTSSAESSKNSDTAADRSSEAQAHKGERDLTAKARTADLIGACAATADELAKTRTLVDALEHENQAVKERLDTEKRLTETMQDLIETRRQESDALRTALSAKNEAIAAKDAVIDSQARSIETLKKKRASPWRRLGDVLIGAAVFAIFK